MLNTFEHIDSRSICIVVSELVVLSKLGFYFRCESTVFILLNQHLERFLFRDKAFGNIDNKLKTDAINFDQQSKIGFILNNIRQ